MLFFGRERGGWASSESAFFNYKHFFNQKKEKKIDDNPGMGVYVLNVIHTIKRTGLKSMCR